MNRLANMLEARTNTEALTILHKANLYKIIYKSVISISYLVIES